MAAIPVTRCDLTAADLRSEPARSKNTRIARRLLALAMVVDGHSRAIAARSGAMDLQTLRDWVHRYNEHGLPGLSDAAHPGRPRSLSGKQEIEVNAWGEKGPDLAEHGVVRWRRIDLRERIKPRFEVTFHVRSVGKILRRLNFRRIGEHLGIPPFQLPQSQGVRQLRRHPPGMPRRLERLDEAARGDFIHRRPRLCIGHNLGPLVSRLQVPPTA